MTMAAKPPVRWLLLFAILVISVSLWLFVTPPNGISESGFNSSLVFIATIACIVAEVMPMGAIGLLAITIFSVLRPSGSDDADQAIKIALSELNSSLIWLIVIAFMIARGFIKTGLSRRIAYF